MTFSSKTILNAYLALVAVVATLLLTLRLIDFKLETVAFFFSGVLILATPVTLLFAILKCSFGKADKADVILFVTSAAVALYVILTLDSLVLALNQL